MQKHILITGGNKGIGLDTTLSLLDQGHKITIIARDFSALKPMDNCTFIEYDLIHIDGIEKLLEGIDDVDVLINNAAIMNPATYDNYTAQQKSDLLKINLEAPMELMRLVSKSMIKKGEGRIVNVASIAGQIGHPDIWYGISKAGLINATKSLAKSIGKHGVVINAVAPGIVETEMLHSIPKPRQEAFLRNVQSGRFAHSDEVAKAIVWLATESPVYINGSCIDINDGAFPR